MCATCGCSGTLDVETTAALGSHGHEHPHDHAHGDRHEHDHEHEHEHTHTHEDSTTTRTVQLEKEILGKNRLLAERNRGWLEGREIFAVNLMSSPGSGKTTL
ncbi:MAG: hypothetical protein ACXWLL_05560, partial [Myxococcaceae bacterium]